MCERHDTTKLKYELLARVQPSDDRNSNYNKKALFFYFNPYKNNIHFTSAALTFVEILVHEQTKMKPNFPNESHFNIL